MSNLEEICAELRPTVAVGAAAIPGAFTERFIELMGEFNEKPIIFALSNPTSKAECTAQQAYTLTQVPLSIYCVKCLSVCLSLCLLLIAPKCLTLCTSNLKCIILG